MRKGSLLINQQGADRKLHALTSLFTLLVVLLTATIPAAAQIEAGIQLSYGRTTYDQILGVKDAVRASQFMNNVWARYDWEDLRFTGVYQGTFGLGTSDIGRHLGQVAANYRFLEEGPMQVYAGLGYHFITNRFKAGLGNQPTSFNLTGHGFAGQVLVDIELNSKLHTTAAVTAAPWVSWSFSDGKTTSKAGSRASFNAKLDVTYSFSDTLSVQVGLVGGSYSVPEFKHEGKTLGVTHGTFAGISAGVTQRF